MFGMLANRTVRTPAMTNSLIKEVPHLVRAPPQRQRQLPRPHPHPRLAPQRFRPNVPAAFPWIIAPGIIRREFPTVADLSIIPAALVVNPISFPRVRAPSVTRAAALKLITAPIPAVVPADQTTPAPVACNNR